MFVQGRGTHGLSADDVKLVLHQMYSASNDVKSV